jgi:hypothetical protein
MSSKRQWIFSRGFSRIPTALKSHLALKDYPRTRIKDVCLYNIVSVYSLIIRHLKA